MEWEAGFWGYADTLYYKLEIMEEDSTWMPWEEVYSLFFLDFYILRKSQDIAPNLLFQMCFKRKYSFRTLQLMCWSTQQRVSVLNRATSSKYLKSARGDKASPPTQPVPSTSLKQVCNFRTRKLF